MASSWLMVKMFDILIGKSRFKGAAVQIQLDDIGDGERLWWQIGEEEFVDDARTRDSDPALLFAGWMGRHHHAAMHARRPHRHIRAVVEASHKLAFLPAPAADLGPGSNAP